MDFKISKKFKTLMGAVIIALIFVSPLSAKIKRQTNKVQELSPTEATEMWIAFKSSKIASDYAMTFEITHSPRRSESVKYAGEILGDVDGDNNYTRIRIVKKNTPNAEISDFIFFTSPTQSKVWKAQGDKFVEIPKSDWAKPIVEGLIYSPIDIFMPYLNWQPSYVGGGRIGQAVYFFDLIAPQEDKIEDISKVTVAVTREFNSPAQTQFFNSKGELAKTVSLSSFKKVDGLWIMLKADARNDITRDKDKLEFQSAKLNIVLDKSIFDPTRKVEPPTMPDLNDI